MTALAPISLIVLGRGGPETLLRCLAAVRQQDHPAFELVIVADPPGCRAAEAAGYGAAAKLVPCAPANRAAARNAGLAAAAGEVVAFLEDHAVPEPTWLWRLTEIFADPRVEAATGGVRLPTGAPEDARWVDGGGTARPLAVDPAAPTLHQGAPGSAVCLSESAAAFRRETLAALGGFDAAFPSHFTAIELALRLAADGAVSAVVPLAQVMAGEGPPPPGRADIARSLAERGAELAMLLRRHGRGQDPGLLLSPMEAAQRRLLVAKMVAGRIEPRDVGRLLAELPRGFARGLSQEIEPALPIAAPAEPFRALPGTGPRPGRVIAGWRWQAKGLRRQAEALTRAGALVTLVLLAPGPARTRVRYLLPGYWEHACGTGLPGMRPGPRLRREIATLAGMRSVDTMLS